MTTIGRNLFLDGEGHALVARLRTAPPGRGYTIRTPLNAWPSRRPAEPDRGPVRDDGSEVARPVIRGRLRAMDVEFWIDPI